MDSLNPTISQINLLARETELGVRALDNLPDGLALFDAAHTLTFWNARAGTFLNLNAQDMLGLTSPMVLDQIAARTTQADDTRSKLDAAFDALAEQPVDLQVKRGEHETFTLTARFFALRDFTGPMVGVGLLLRDVTREREADAMKSQLLSTVSHELRTPLASIKGFATTLLRKDVKWDEATQRDFLRIIEEESDRLTEIIDNLLEMSQIEVGALRVKTEPTQLRTLIRDVVDETRMRTESHYFITDLPNELPRALADPRRIRQVLRNLLENAIKYTKGGAISVTCEVAHDHILISVADEGDGIPPALLEKVFERFFQVDGASTRKVGGSGLGLAISRGIVEAHGGKIWAEQNSPRGTIFRLTLPLAPAEPEE